MMNYTHKSILADDYDTRVIIPNHPCPRCHKNDAEVVGAQCSLRGKVWGEYRCKRCGEIYGKPMDTRD